MSSLFFLVCSPVIVLCSTSHDSTAHLNTTCPFVLGCCCRLPEDVRLWPSIGNGHISMVAHSENTFMNGLYNGYTTTSHRAAIPCPLSANVTRINNREATNRTYVLDTKAGTVYYCASATSEKRYWRHTAFGFVHL